MALPALGLNQGHVETWFKLSETALKPHLGKERCIKNPALSTKHRCGK
jgi:hypothetical protein